MSDRRPRPTMAKPMRWCGGLEGAGGFFRLLSWRRGVGESWTALLVGLCWAASEGRRSCGGGAEEGAAGEAMRDSDAEEADGVAGGLRDGARASNSPMDASLRGAVPGVALRDVPFRDARGCRWLSRSILRSMLKSVLAVEGADGLTACSSCRCSRPRPRSRCSGRAGRSGSRRRRRR